MGSFFSSTERFFNLSPREQMLVALGVLIDGKESIDVFNIDSNKRYLVQVVSELCEIPLQLRIPLLATALREASRLSKAKGEGHD